MDRTFGITTTLSPQLNLALLVLRIASALAFLFHGSAILFGAFGGPGPAGFAGFMHMPLIVGYLVGLAQFAGGICHVDWRFHSRGRGMPHHRHAGRDFSGAPAPRLRYWTWRNRVCPHSATGGFCIIVDRTGSLLVGRLITGIAAAIIIEAVTLTLHLRLQTSKGATTLTKRIFLYPRQESRLRAQFSSRRPAAPR